MQNASTNYQIMNASILDHTEAAQQAFMEDVLIGFSETPKKLPSHHFYDHEGSRLFGAITDCDEYYLTAAEFEILERHAEEILSSFRGVPFDLVDLGAGDGRKTRVLIRKAREMGLDMRYVPIDISEGAMQTVVSEMAERFPGLTISGIVNEYTEGVRWLGQQSERCSLLLFLGSNIGNFDKAHARAFLRRLWTALKLGDRALIGFDLKKDIELLLAAYNDREGVTARFNLNLLARINRDLDADFDLSRFRHFATYNVFSGAMESYLVSQEQQTVTIKALRNQFHFAPWEPIHTEYSYKYLKTDIQTLAERSGFVIDAQFLDSRAWFCDALWSVQR